MRTRWMMTGVALIALAACDTSRETPEVLPPAPVAAPISPETAALYSAMPDGELTIPAIPLPFLSDDKARQIVDYWTDEPVGTIIVDPYDKRLYHVRANNTAMRYTVGVGAAGYGFTGEAHTPYQRDWPRWTPTDNMLAQNPAAYAPSADGVPGGLDNPMGARALYIHNSGGDTFYRIHGTPDPESIGAASSAGCIRLFNQDIIHLAERTDSMSKVIVLNRAQAGQGTVQPGQLAIAAASAPPSITSGDITTLPIYETVDITGATP